MQLNINNVFSIILLPLLGSIVSGFFGRNLELVDHSIISSSVIIITTILAIISFFWVGFNNNPVSIILI